MKRSVLAVTLGVVMALALTNPALAADPDVSKSVLAGGESSVVLLNVSAGSKAVYAVTITDASGSISDIIAPDGWVGITSGSKVLFRTGTKPVRSGQSLGFRIITSNESGALGISFHDDEMPIGSKKNV